MRTLLFYVKIYLRCATQYLKARMQYRVDFIISTIGMGFSSISTIFVFKVSIYHHPQSGRMDIRRNRVYLRILSALDYAAAIILR